MTKLDVRQTPVGVDELLHRASDNAVLAVNRDAIEGRESFPLRPRGPFTALSA